MKKSLTLALSFIFLVTLISFCQAYSIDINTDKESYSVGENIIYEVILLQDNKPIQQEVNITFSDILSKKTITTTIPANIKQELLIEENFTSGFWKIQANYENFSVEGRGFTIKENQGVKFEIIGEKLLITNTGNVPYQKQIQIVIDKTISTKYLNLKVGETKELRLAAPSGKYNIKVTDGETTLTRQNIQLTGTGNVIGALDEDLTKQSPFTSLNPDEDTAGFFSSNISLALVFIAAVFGLGILILVQKRVKNN